MHSAKLRELLYPRHRRQEYDQNNDAQRQQHQHRQSAPTSAPPDGTQDHPNPLYFNVPQQTPPKRDDDRFVRDNQYVDAPAMLPDQARIFENVITPAIQNIGRETAYTRRTELSSSSRVSGATHSSTPSTTTSDSDGAHLSKSERKELLDMEADVNDWRDPFLSKRAPDKCDDITKLPMFRAFDHRWMTLLLSDIQVQNVFIYFHTIALGGPGAVADDVDSTLYGCECFGVSVEVLDRGKQYVRARVYFAPKTFDGRKFEEDSAMAKARKAVEHMRNLGTTRGKSSTNSRMASASTLGNEYGELSAVELMRRATEEFDDKRENSVINYRTTRKEALLSLPPYEFFWDRRNIMTPEMLESVAVEKYKEMVNRMQDMRVEAEDGAAVAGPGGSECESSADDDDGGGDGEEMNSEDSDDDDYDAFKGMVVPGDISTSNMIKHISSSVSSNLTRFARRQMRNVFDAGPGSVAQPSSEVSGWVEDHLCIDLVIYPGVRDNDDDDDNQATDELCKQRTLVFCFSVCEQNPYSFGEIVRSGVNAGGPFDPHYGSDDDDEGGNTTADSAQQAFRNARQKGRVP